MYLFCITTLLPPFKLYRDCLRLVRHIAPGESPKGMALRSTVRMEFGKNKNENDEAKIEVMKAGAIRALSNYMLYESGAKDQTLGKAMNKFNNDTMNSGAGGGDPVMKEGDRGTSKGKE